MQYPALRILLTLNRTPECLFHYPTRCPEHVFPNPILDVRYPELTVEQWRSFARLTGMNEKDLKRILTEHDSSKLSGRFVNWIHTWLLKQAYKSAVTRGMRID